MDFNALRIMLERHEGNRPFPYVDTAGKVTIGIGHNLTDDGITPDQATMFYDSDLDAVIRDLQSFPWWDSLSDERQQAIADMRFNLGRDGFREFRKMIHALAIGDFQSAALEMRQSRWAIQVGNRAEELAQMVEHG